MNIYSIPNKLDVNWYPDILCVVESWKNYDVDLEEFRKAVFVKGINHARASQFKAWIFDGSQAQGSFGPEVQSMIDQDRFPALAWAGAKYFFTVDAAASEVSVDPDTADTRGVQRATAPSADAALAWLRAKA